MAAKKQLESIRHLLGKLSGAYSSMLFVDAPLAGLVILAATFLHPAIAVSGVCGMVLALAQMRVFGLHAAATARGVILCNSLLVGLYVGHLYLPSLGSLALGAVAVGLTLVTTLALEPLFQAQGLPMLSLPFSLVALLLGAASPQFTNLIDATPYFFERLAPPLTGLLEAAPPFVSAALRSQGAIFCLPDPLFGLIVWLALAIKSPLSGAFAICGFYLGWAVESSLMFDANSAFNGHLFNYSLLFPVLAVVFVAPSRFSLSLAVGGVALGTLITAGLLALQNAWHAPVTALPFNLTALLLLRATRHAQPHRMSSAYSSTPEQTIDRARLYRLRHRSGEYGMYCPFEGEWSVSQGFDGKWTHRGPWRHGLDFVVKGDDGKTFRNQGFDLEDYHAFGKAVLAPVDAYVVAVCGGQPDNPIGRVANQKNWGNHVILRTFDGVHVALAHLRQDSVCVAIGEYVTAGKKIGECGNSGYSQHPHLHLQAQWLAIPGAHTIPFHLVNFASGDRVHFQDVPREGASIRPVPMNVELDRALSFKIGDRVRFAQSSTSKEIEFTTCLDEAKGTLYWTDGSAKLYFAKSGAQFFCYGFEGDSASPLADALAALSRIPITHGSVVHHEDHLPLPLTDRAPWRWAKLALALGGGGESQASARYRTDGTTLSVEGRARLNGRECATRAQLDPVLGILEFEAAGRRYQRIDNAIISSKEAA